MARLQRIFPSREELVHGFLRGLSERGMEVGLPGPSALPPGAAIDLDLRLADGSPLIVGRGEVGAGAEDGVRHVRFLELDVASRAELPGLVALAGGAPGGASESPRDAVAPVDTRDPDETLEALVAGVFGARKRRPGPDDTVLVPPEPAAGPVPAEPPAHAAAAPPVPVSEAVSEPAPAPRPATEPAPAGRPAPAPSPPAPPSAAAAPHAAAARRPSLFRRLQVSPAVIVASIVAGATGAAANAWLEDLANVFERTEPPPAADLLPVGVTPSRFPDPGPAPAPAPEGVAPAPPSGLPAAPETVPAAAAPVAVEAGPPGGSDAAPADRVQIITWDEREAETVVTFRGNGAFLPERIAYFRVGGGHPREVVKLRGIDLPYPQTELDLGTPEVLRVRTGFHPQKPVNELHVVLDLADPDVVIGRVETAPGQLRLHLRRPAAGPAPGGR